MLVSVGGIPLSQITTDSPNAEIQVIPQRDSAHDEAHVEGAESQLELAGAEVALGDVEAGHCVGIAPNRDHGVPRPRVELLPGQFPGGLRGPRVAGGGARGDGGEGVAAFVGDLVQERGELGVEGWGVEGHGCRGIGGVVVAMAADI